MSRTSENKGLNDYVKNYFESIEDAGLLELAGARDAMSLLIQLDISRSLAVIADALQAEKETE